MFFFAVLYLSLCLHAQVITDVVVTKPLKTLAGRSRDHVTFKVDGQQKAGIRFNINEDGFNPEQISYEVDKFMHGGTSRYVPGTYTYREASGLKYVLQETIQGDETETVVDIPDDLKVLDFIIGNTSRYKSGKDMVYSGGRIYAVNNDIVFNNSLPSGAYIKMMAIFRGSRWVNSLMPSEEMKQALTELDIEGLKLKLEPHVGDREEYLPNLVERAEYLKKAFFMITDLKFIEKMETPSGASYRVSFRKNGVLTKGLMKPVRNISISDIIGMEKALSVYQDISDENYRNAEQAAYEFDQYLGTDFVPTTYTYNYEDATFTIQEWIDGAETKGLEVPDDMEAFDFMTGNLDRFWVRNLIKKGNRFYAIDNELAFPNPTLNICQHINQMTLVGRKHPSEYVLTETMKDKIRKLETKELYPLLSPYIRNREHIDEMSKRVTYLKAIVNGEELTARKIMEDDGKAVLLRYMAIGDSGVDDNLLLEKFFAMVYEEIKLNNGFLSRETIGVMARNEVVAYMEGVSAMQINKSKGKNNQVLIYTDLLKKITDAERLRTANPMRYKVSMEEYRFKYEEMKGIMRK